MQPSVSAEPPDLWIANQISKVWVLLIVWTFIGFLSGCSQGKIIESQWKAGDITVDGHGEDWAAFALRYDERLKCSYGILNDDHDLFLLVRFRDAYVLPGMEHPAITVWFDPGCRQARIFGILYASEDVIVIPGQFSPADWGEGNPALRGRMEGLRGPIPPESRGRFTLVTKGDGAQHIQEQGLKGVQAAMGRQGGAVCLEFKVPLVKESDESVAVNATPPRVIQMGVEIGSAGAEDAGGGEERLPGGRRDRGLERGMGDSMPRGSPPVGMPGAGREDFRKSIEAGEIWIKIRLASKGVPS